MLKTVTISAAAGAGTNGTVTSVNTGTGLTGGPITTTGTISLANTAVTPDTYGGANNVASLVVDQQGRITSASNVAISIAPSQINATIPNSGLTNSSTTLGNTALVLGSTASAVGNLTLNNVTIGSGNSTITNANVAYENISAALRTQSLTGYLYGNANTGNVTASTTIPNTGLTNNSTTLGNTALTLGGTSASVGNLTLLGSNHASGTMVANVVNFTSNTSTNATFQTSSLQLVPAGYMPVVINGTTYKVPYYTV